MSTIDSLLVVVSSAVVRDFYQQIFRKESVHKNLTGFFSRAVAYGIRLPYGVAFYGITTPERTIFWFVVFGWSGIAATFAR